MLWLSASAEQLAEAHVAIGDVGNRRGAVTQALSLVELTGVNQPSLAQLTLRRVRPT